MKRKPIVIAHIMGKWVGGGVESVVMNYYRNIDRNKIQFDFICDSDSTCVPVKEIEAMGGNVIFVPPYQKLIPYMKELKKIFKQKKYKIVQSHINTLSVFPLSVAKSVGIPIRIAHSHSTTNIREWNKNLIKLLLRPFSKLYATHYFTCGELSGRFLFGNKLYDSNKVFLMRNAINLDKFVYNEKIRKEYRKKFNINNNQIVVGHVGRFVTQKNHVYLIKIFNELYKKNKNVILFLVGNGPLENKIKNKVKKLGLENNIKFLGQRDDIANIYQMFDILLLPSLYEGLSVVGVEAQVSGLLCAFSTFITKELKLIDSTMFIPLNKHPKIWADLILNNFKKYVRIKSNKFLDYELKKEVCKLEKKYIELVEE